MTTKATGAIIPPLHPSTTFLRDEDNLYRRGRMYARADNPTYDAAADTITAMEGGAATLLFSSGMAAANAVFLALVIEVLYPGLPGFKGREVAQRQMQGGFGGMLSIRVAGGESAAMAVAAHVAIWKRATSLGSVESLIEHRASVEGEGSPVPADLWGDLLQALNAGVPSAR
jgi:cystathionine beta-lyase/cystathionine gamma-synthase